METKKNNIEFIPKFEKSFLLPRYWGAWFGVFAFGARVRAAGRKLTCCTAFRKKASRNVKK